MELHNRKQLEDKVALGVRRAFKSPRTKASRRQPPWASLKRDLVKQIAATLEKVQLDAIRQMFAVYGDGPAPDSLKPNAEQRAADMADDLIAVSKRRWARIKKPRTDEQFAEWRKVNFGSERAELIAITEVTIAHQTGEDIAWRELKRQGIRIEGWWVCEENPCKFCAAMRGKPSRVWRKVYPAGPPSPHPACRCMIMHERLN